MTKGKSEQRTVGKEKDDRGFHVEDRDWIAGSTISPSDASCCVYFCSQSDTRRMWTVLLSKSFAAMPRPWFAILDPSTVTSVEGFRRMLWVSDQLVSSFNSIPNSWLHSHLVG